MRVELRGNFKLVLFLVHCYCRSKAMDMWSQLNKSSLLVKSSVSQPIQTLRFAFPPPPKSHIRIIFAIQTSIQRAVCSARLESAPKLHQQRTGNRGLKTHIFLHIWFPLYLSLVTSSSCIWKTTKIRTSFPSDSRWALQGHFLHITCVSSVKWPWFSTKHDRSSQGSTFSLHRSLLHHFLPGHSGCVCSTPDTVCADCWALFLFFKKLWSVIWVPAPSWCSHKHLYG